MQSKSTFPARIAPFSVPIGRMEAVQGLRKRDSRGKRGLTLHCCISITEEVKINDLQKSLVFTCISILK